MKSAIISLTLLLSTFRIAFGLTEPMPLGRQVHEADAILRVVVVSYDLLKINEDEESFQAIAKCRVIEDYKGDYRLGQFIYIPCAYNVDEDPSPIDREGDYVVFLNTLEVAPIGHPVAFNAVHSINQGKITDPENDDKEVLLSAFVERVSKLLKNKAEQGSAGQPATRSQSSSPPDTGFCGKHQKQLVEIHGFGPPAGVMVSPSQDLMHFVEGKKYPNPLPWDFSTEKPQMPAVPRSVFYCVECNSEWQAAYNAFKELPQEKKLEQWESWLQRQAEKLKVESGPRE
jgi:hypothetical protein